VLGLVPQLIDLRARDAAPRVPPGGTPVLAASKLLRHATTEVTEKVYTAVDPRWLRAQVNRMPLDLSRLAPQVDERWKIHRMVRKRRSPDFSETFLRRNRGLQSARYRIRTCGLWLRRPTLYPAELIAQTTDRSRSRTGKSGLAQASGAPGELSRCSRRPRRTLPRRGGTIRRGPPPRGGPRPAA
jgi:hypothetical protein